MRILAHLVTGPGRQIEDKLNHCFQANTISFKALDDKTSLIAVRTEVPADAIRSLLFQVLKAIPGMGKLTYQKSYDPECYWRLEAIGWRDIDLAKRKASEKVMPVVPEGERHNPKDFEAICHFIARILAPKLRRPPTPDEVRTAWENDKLMMLFGDPEKWSREIIKAVNFVTDTWRPAPIR